MNAVLLAGLLFGQIEPLPTGKSMIEVRFGEVPLKLHEGHGGLALHSHLRAALALRAVTDTLGADWRVERVAYRLRLPLYAPIALTYTARVTAVGDDTLTLELIEENGRGDVGFEGTASVTRITRDAADTLPVSSAGATT